MLERTKKYYQENAEASVARKRGVVNASGDYRTFVDSDAGIEEDMYERMLERVRHIKQMLCALELSVRDQVITYEKDTVASGQCEREQIKKDYSNHDLGQKIWKKRNYRTSRK